MALQSEQDIVQRAYTVYGEKSKSLGDAFAETVSDMSEKGIAKIAANKMAGKWEAE